MQSKSIAMKFIPFARADATILLLSSSKDGVLSILTIMRESGRSKLLVDNTKHLWHTYPFYFIRLDLLLLRLKTILQLLTISRSRESSSFVQKSTQLKREISGLILRFGGLNETDRSHFVPSQHKKAAFAFWISGRDFVRCF